MSPFIKTFIRFLAHSIGSGVSSGTRAYPQWMCCLEEDNQLANN